ncbi:MAG: hypothetical protein AAB358_02345 [Patescibacteria group bacterium]
MAYKRMGRQSDYEDEPIAEEEIQETQDFAYHHGQKGWAKVLITILILAVVLVGAWFVVDRYTTFDFWGLLPSANLGAKSWQAVFLTNGQVYFGKIIKETPSKLVLVDIYYLQVVNKPLQTSDQSQNANTNQSQQDLSLIKLGNEIHGPADEMVINRDQVLLTEKLRNDSKVVQSINKYVQDQSQVK